MLRWKLMICMLALPVIVSGCAMCCGTDDFTYPMLDNCRYPRLDPEYGRVGSVYSDPNVPYGPIPLTNADVEREEISPESMLPDDPDFNNDIDATDPRLDPQTDPFQPGQGDNVDTSAARPRRIPVRSPSWR